MFKKIQLQPLGLQCGASNILIPGSLWRVSELIILVFKLISWVFKIRVWCGKEKSGWEREPHDFPMFEEPRTQLSKAERKVYFSPAFSLQN